MAATSPKIIPMGYTPPTRPAAPKNQRFTAAGAPIDDREKPDGIEILVAVIVAIILSPLWVSAILAMGEAMRNEEPREVLRAEVE